LTVRMFRDADEGRAFIMSRRDMGTSELSPRMREGVRSLFGEDLSADEVVTRILHDVRTHGDEAVREYTQKIDGVDLGDVRVSDAEIVDALESVPEDIQKALCFAADRIRRFHEKQHIDSWIDFGPEGGLGQLVRPLDRVGVYAPGGTAPYPSSLLMTAIPARVAGVEDVIVCAPPERNGQVAPITVVAAHIAGVKDVYKIGGAQAIGAMAYGTGTVRRVDKILGPGNIFVVLAKRKVFGTVDIDALPGPTETMVLADHTASVELCAADMLAQAEHDQMASAIMVTTSQSLADAVSSELDRQLQLLDREAIARESLDNNGAIIVADTLQQSFDVANAYAPEHLCLLIESPWDHIASVRHAGGIFIGESSPEVVGDYTAGPSHVMPTGGTARFSSPVNVGDFLKIISVIGLNETGLRQVGPKAAVIARAEGLTAHAEAVEKRLANLK